MASKFPEIADCPENIISLTPNQHFYRAHPENKTQIIDKAERIMKEYFEYESLFSFKRRTHFANLSLTTSQRYIIFVQYRNFE